MFNSRQCLYNISYFSENFTVYIFCADVQGAEFTAVP